MSFVLERHHGDTSQITKGLIDIDNRPVDIDNRPVVVGNGHPL